MEVTKIAQICHEVNREFCRSIGDNSQLAWKDAPEWQRDSAVAGVKYKIANPNVTPADMHAEWFRHKEADGWVWGEIKNVEAKTHPCMVPYNQLPKDQQTKDHLFAAIVGACLDS